MGETRRHEGPIKGEIGRFAKSNRFHSVRTSGAAFETHWRAGAGGIAVMVRWS